jgi:hypothetical protein
MEVGNPYVGIISGLPVIQEQYGNHVLRADLLSPVLLDIDSLVGSFFIVRAARREVEFQQRGEHGRS